MGHAEAGDGLAGTGTLPPDSAFGLCCLNQSGGVHGHVVWGWRLGGDSDERYVTEWRRGHCVCRALEFPPVDKGFLEFS